MTAGNYSELTIYRRLLRQARPCWPHLGGVILLSLLSGPLALLAPLPLKIVVDSVLGSYPLPGFLEALLPEAVTRSSTAIFIFAVGFVVAVALLIGIVQLANTVLTQYTGEKLVLNFRARLFRQAARLSILYHDIKGTTDPVARGARTR